MGAANTLSGDLSPCAGEAAGTVARPAACDRLATFLAVVLTLEALLVFVSFALVSLSRLNDRRGLDHVSGVWIGLSCHLNHGTLYPAVYDGQTYAGTRYMPGYFTAHALLARVTGEYQVSGKVLSLLVMAACWMLVYRILRGAGCSTSLALALAALGPVSSLGLEAASTIRGDALAVLWQLSALAAAAQDRSRSHAAGAALLCTLAVFTKVTALWAPLAITCYYWPRDRRYVFVFLAVWLTSLFAGLAALHLIISGRMLDNFRVIAESSGGRLLLLFKSPFRLLRFLKGSSLLMLLTPFLVLEIVRAIRQRRLTVYHYGCLCCLPILLLIYGDRGTTANHLIDLVVLAPLLMGFLWSSTAGWTSRQTGLPALVVTAILWALATLWSDNLGVCLRDTFAVGPSRAATAPNAGQLAAVLLGERGLILAEDPAIVVARGQVPVVLDPYMLPYIEKKHPEWIAALARRIHNKEFACIVLSYRLDLDPEVNEGWYRILFGQTIAGAIRVNYRFAGQADGRCVYAPADN
ncbi:MAG TPA: hypothetical protein VMG10_07270 [Gemmataceae bacterium]|nr:hypothetical protein [Gemmataceae bacterium]